MTRRVGHVLHDMLQAIGFAFESAEGKDENDFIHDWRFRLAFERALEIISEASRSLPRKLKARHPAIKWQELQDLGNILRHRYDSVSANILLKIVKSDLPALQSALEDMQTNLPEEDSE